MTEATTELEIDWSALTNEPAQEKPVRRREAAPAAPMEDEEVTPKLQIRGGWGEADKVNNADSGFAQRLTVKDEPQIVKFLVAEPYASFRQHWVERAGQRSFTCLSDTEKGCPLCDVGHKTATRFCFNVAVLTEGEEPELRSWEVGPRVMTQLKNFHTDPRQGPLDKNFWAISKTGKGKTTNTVVKERDLESDWNLTAITDVQLKDLQGRQYTADIVQVNTRKSLLDVALEMSEDD
jgi:hypothetical protein